jgi:hypothetical protein
MHKGHAIAEISLYASDRTQCELIGRGMEDLRYSSYDRRYLAKICEIYAIEANLSTFFCQLAFLSA